MARPDERRAPSNRLTFGPSAPDKEATRANSGNAELERVCRRPSGLAREKRTLAEDWPWIDWGQDSLAAALAGTWYDHCFLGEPPTTLVYAQCGLRDLRPSELEHDADAHAHALGRCHDALVEDPIVRSEGDAGDCVGGRHSFPSPKLRAPSAHRRTIHRLEYSPPP
ncbi:MAG: hypothetical protein M1826_002847 [Phylliscum demangeonii]|nr:MAG: hypothetical protein M1826_002847 [Phylliscum demangeonii]